MADLGGRPGLRRGLCGALSRRGLFAFSAQGGELNRDEMRAYLLALSLLAVVAVSLATSLEPWFQSWAGSRSQSGSPIQVALGDSRKLFAKHVFFKADAYFHNGYYPTIYDNNQGYEKAHIVEDMHESGEESEPNFLGKPRDWVDAFSRHFYPTRHTHLGLCANG